MTLHFHFAAKCRTCWTTRTYSTPIPSVLTLSSQCQWCGGWDMIGIDTVNEHLCLPCIEAHEQDAREQANPHPPAKA